MAQLVSDSTYSWRSYASVATCSISIYATHAKREEVRKRLIVIRELADNAGPPATADARYLADRISRDFGFDPVEAIWVFHWGSFSHAGASNSRKELFVRATFRRTDAGNLGSALWRVVSREQLEELTDRAFTGFDSETGPSSRADHGASRETVHLPLSARSYTTRSCNRLGLPCQNSTRLGVTT